MQHEMWRDIKDWEGFYQVSNFGRVRRIPCQREDIFGRKYQLEERILKPVPNNQGYYRMHLKIGKNEKDRKFVHRLVAEAFIPNPNNYPCVNHKDFNPKNNSVDNLEFVTHQQNMDYSIAHGRFRRTETWLKNQRAALEKTYKPVVGTNKKTGEQRYYKNLNAVEADGFRPSAVCHCCKGKRYSHAGYVWRYAS